MRRLAISTILWAASAFAQQPVAPTEPHTGSPRGENVGEYNVVNWFETGYRFRSVGGNLGKFRSDVNYSNGIRLLASSLTVHSREGAGPWFDEIVLTTQGLGNDPYESATFRVQRNKLYRYDMIWRQNAYYNPALTVALGQHFMDTLRRLQDHDLTILPQSPVQFFIGFSRVLQTGPALSTIQLFDARGDEFPLFSNIRRQRNEYRIGNEIRALGFKLNWMRGWDNFKEDTPTDLLTPTAGNNANDNVTLTTLRRREPYHGNSPYWRVALFKEGKDWYAVNGRFTYTEGRRAFVLDESELGSARIGSVQRQVLTFGDARRPAATGNLTFSVFPGTRVTLTNHTAIYNIRMEGDSRYLLVDNGTAANTQLNFQFLGVRTFANQTDLNVRINPVVGLFAGYTYSARRIRSTERLDFGGEEPDLETAEQKNHLNAATLGVRLKPIKPLTIIVDTEIGRANRPIYPISDRDYHLFGARVHYKLGSFSASAHVRTNYNTNSVSLSAFSSRSRTYSGDISWSPRGWVSFDASYSKLHLDTVGGIAYFLNSRLITGENSYYFSNLHHGNLAARFPIRNRAELYVGYSRVQDTGDGRSNPLGSGIGSALPILQAAQTFPLVFQSPSARFSLRLHERLRWNAGYQYYGYSEEFSTLQSYRANTGYTSLTWSF